MRGLIPFHDAGSELAWHQCTIMDIPLAFMTSWFTAISTIRGISTSLAKHGSAESTEQTFTRTVLTGHFVTFRAPPNAPVAELIVTIITGIVLCTLPSSWHI